MTEIRRPAVAGSFYPAEPQALRGMVEAFLAAVPDTAGPPPKAVIVPHAGFVYSGPVAASVYARLRALRDVVTRVVLIGPSHHVGFAGLALTDADAYATPLGVVPVDRAACAVLAARPGIAVRPEAHDREHSLEVHLPFLQVVLGAFRLVPIVAGDAAPAQVAAVLDAVWGGPETLVVVSSDLSHYLDYDSCRRVDTATTAAIESLRPEALGPDQACGRVPVAGLLAVARDRGLVAQTVDLRNSGDTNGPRDRVVGYGGWVFAAADPVQRHAETLLRLAHDSIAHGVAHGAALAVAAGVYDAALDVAGASFVTLHRGGQLRGCVGSAVAWRPLVADVAENAYAAACRDPRFPPVGPDELPALEVSISVLTPPAPLTFATEADLLAQLRPAVDGLIIDDDGRRALFLPMVWEQLPDPRAFLAHLKVKAGLGAAHWSPRFTASRFTAVKLGA